MTPQSRLVAGLFSNRLLVPAICAMFVIFTLANAWLFAHPELLTRRGITDFQDFYVAGKLALGGRTACAYEWECLKQAQIAQFGRWEYMPWAYPPQFTAFVALLATIPHSVAFAAFVLASFALFVFVIVRLAGRQAGFALALTLPAILINGRSGQNGFLTAGLLGLFALGALYRRRGGGIALGAMIIKPHLAAASGLLVLWRRNWSTALRAGAVVAGSALVATAMLGTAAWPAFRAASASSAALLWQGHFPIERMTSVFAMLSRMGAPPEMAMIAHAGVALAALAGLGFVAVKCRDERIVLAATMVVTVLISPYNYDYDLTILTVALALIAPIVVERLSGVEALLLGGLSWLSAANFGLMILALKVVPGATSKEVWSLSALCIAGMIVLAGRAVLRRPASAEALSSS